MTKVIETKMVEQTTVKFIAEDGKEFVGDFAEVECKSYELYKNRNKVADKFMRLCPVTLIPNITEWVNSNAIYRLIRLETERDFEETLMEYAEVDFEDSYNLREAKPKSFPCDVVLFEDDGYIGIYGTKEKFISELEDTLQKTKG